MWTRPWRASSGCARWSARSCACAWRSCCEAAGACARGPRQPAAVCPGEGRAEEKASRGATEGCAPAGLEGPSPQVQRPAEEAEEGRQVGSVKYLSTRGGAQPQNFSDILLEGLAPDGGLYVPESL